MNQMKKKVQNLAYAVIAIVGLGLQSSYGQTDTKTDNHTIGITIPEVALLDIELAASKNITMAFTAPSPSEAGNPIVAPTDNTALWLNYSSIVTASGLDATRKVTVYADVLIPGIDIKVTAGADAGAGAGTKGTPSSQLTLTAGVATAQDIITGIGSCWTDTGASKGHQLTYSLGLTSAATYSSLRAGTTTVTVTYTLSDN